MGAISPGFDKAITKPKQFIQSPQTVPLSKPTNNSPKFFETIRMNKFILLNSQGVPRLGFFIEITEVARGSAPGFAIFSGGVGKCDVVSFKFNPETQLFDARGRCRRTHAMYVFTMRPITVHGGDYDHGIVGLDIQFSDIPHLTAHYALDLSTNEEDIVYDTFVPPVHFAEMKECSF